MMNKTSSDLFDDNLFYLNKIIDNDKLLQLKKNLSEGKPKNYSEVEYFIQEYNKIIKLI